MPIQLMLCSLCTQSRPDFLRTLARLIAEYPHELCVVELECMAACDDVPAIMLETDYHPQLSAADLCMLVRERIMAAST